MLKVLLWSLLAVGVLPATVAAQDVLRVAGDHLVELDLPAEIGTVLVANPAVADVAPVDRQRLAIIGKHPGSTSLIVFAKTGERLASRTVVVVGDDAWTVTVHRGAAETTLTCAPRCVPTGGTGSAASAQPAAPTPAPAPSAGP